VLQRLNDFLHGFELRSTGKWFVLSALVGLVVGLAAIAFQFLGQAVGHYAMGRLGGYSPAEPAGEHSFFDKHDSELNLGMLIVVMVGGGLASGIIVSRFGPEAAGPGTDAVIDAFHNERGTVRARIPLVKTIASAITLGTGGSGGREGPIAQIGGGIGSLLATRLELSDRDRRILLAAGMGAGVGAIFRAPLAGALFAAEILYKDADLESDAIVPSAIASIVGYSVYSLSLSDAKRFAPLFGDVPDYGFVSLMHLLPLVLLAVVLVLVGVLYIKVFHHTQSVFARLPVPVYLRPAIGTLIAGCLAAALFSAMGEDRRTLSVLSTGYGALQDALNPHDGVAVKLFILIAFVKILTTSLTLGSGGSAGVFGPSMVIGGCVGVAVGSWLHAYFPSLVPEPGLYAIVGMAGFFAGTAHAPISTIIMVSEMTGEYSLLLPTMWVSTLCALLCRRWTIYLHQVPTRIESPAHRGDFIVDVLEGIRVAEVYQPDPNIKFIPESMSLDDIVHTLAETQQHYFPVADEAGKMVGIFSSDDVRLYLYDETIWHLAVARDVMVTDIVSVTPEDDLNTALRRFTSLNLDELPVLDPRDSGKLLGMLRRKETIAFYNRQVLKHKQGIDAGSIGS